MASLTVEDERKRRIQEIESLRVWHAVQEQKWLMMLRITGAERFSRPARLAKLIWQRQRAPMMLRGATMELMS